MAIYQLTDKSLKPIAETSFGAEGIMERKDLQRLLRDQINHGTGQGVKNKAAFRALESQREPLEKVFGDELDWQELPESESCRICYTIEGGYRSPHV